MSHPFYMGNKMIVYYGPLAILLIMIVLSAMSSVFADLFGIHETEVTVLLSILAIIPVINFLVMSSLIISIIVASDWYNWIVNSIESIFTRD